jgi:two-component system, NarL family, sensor histidine kinase UhpB
VRNPPKLFALTAASKPASDLALIVLLSIATFLIGVDTEFSETLAAATQKFESLQLDEVPLALLTLSLGLAWFAWRRWREMLRELEQRLNFESALELKQLELRDLSRRVIGAQEAERRLLAHELHDELGQTLNAIKIEAVGIRNGSSDAQPALHRAAVNVIRLTDRVYAVVRDMTSRLRPVALDELGLVGALEHDLMGWRQRLPATRFTLGIGELPRDIDEPVAIALYRVAQEGMTNVVRHAEAQNATLELDFVPASAVLRLTLQDDGRGVELKAIRHGLGLVGMRERIEALGGIFRIESQPAQGFRLEASVPLDGPDACGGRG